MTRQKPKKKNIFFYLSNDKVTIEGFFFYFGFVKVSIFDN